MVIVMNHQNMLDFTHTMLFGKHKITPVGKTGAFYSLTGIVIRYVYIIINKKNSAEAIKKINEVVDETIRTKKVIKLFVWPEGKRNPEGMGEFKKGAFHVAITKKIPIVPLVCGPINDCVDHKSKRFNPYIPIYHTVLPKIDTSNMTLDDLPELMANTKALMQQTHDALVKQCREDLFK